LDESSRYKVPTLMGLSRGPLITSTETDQIREMRDEGRFHICSCWLPSGFEALRPARGDERVCMRSEWLQDAIRVAGKPPLVLRSALCQSGDGEPYVTIGRGRQWAIGIRKVMDLMALWIFPVLL